MVNVAIIQTVLQIQMGISPSLLSFDYQSNSSGRILLRDCYSQAVQAEIVTASNISINRYKHVSWNIQSYCKSYTVNLDETLKGNIIVRNGWVYEPSNILSGGVLFYLQFDGKNWMATNNSMIGAKYYQNPARLQFHFSAITGWINDPNGLVYENGLYHLYYQYNPYQAHWENMHWGHAVSRDLISWQNLPIAIYPSPELTPRYLGGIFTGSALFSGEKHQGLFVAAYTDHLEDVKSSPDVFIEKQKIATSKDSLTFTNAKTVIPRNPHGSTKNFRDPKIWYDSARKVYFMVIGTFMRGAPSVLLYKSADYYQQGGWTFVGILYQAPSTMQNVVTVECPDIFPLEDKYVLVFNTYQAKTEPNQVSSNATIWAVIGHFDGQNFSTAHQPQRIDFGIHFYAMQSYNGAPKRIGIGWMNCWNDLKLYKDQHSFAGAMATPRQIILSPDKTRIGLIPASDFTRYRSTVAPLFAQNGFFSSPVQISNSSKTMEIQISVPNVSDDWQLEFYNADKGNQGMIRLLWQSSSQTVSLINSFPNQIRTVTSRKISGGTLALTILLDVTSIEVFINNGFDCGTMRFVPPVTAIPTVNIRFSSSKVGSMTTLKAWKLHSIWSTDFQLPKTTQTPTSQNAPLSTTIPNSAVASSIRRKIQIIVFLYLMLICCA